ncbi:hypothetical protein CERZMDRAFT_5765, partial [Cercospora zeae-maydis SCOH1-5]
NNVVTITVGTGANSEDFVVHDFLLKQSSSFFQAALKEEWKEGQEKIVNLPEDHSEAFALYVEWLFSGKIASGSDKPEGRLSSSEITREHLVLANLYVLGEKLLDDHFCAQTRKATAELCDIEDSEGYRIFPNYVAINIIYAGTKEGSPMREWLVNAYSEHGSKAWVEDADSRTFCVDFLLDLVK